MLRTCPTKVFTQEEYLLWTPQGLQVPMGVAIRFSHPLSVSSFALELDARHKPFGRGLYRHTLAVEGVGPRGFHLEDKAGRTTTSARIAESGPLCGKTGARLGTNPFRPTVTI